MGGGTTIRAVGKNEGRGGGSENSMSGINAENQSNDFKYEKNSVDIPTVREKVENINEYVDRIEQIIKPIYDREVAKLDEVFKAIEEIKNKAKGGAKLDVSKLEVLFLDLVSEMADLTERIEERALDVDIAKAFFEENAGKALLHANDTREKKGLSNASLQKAYANNLVAVDEYTLIVKNRIYKRLESKINSAERLFYGIKAILGRR
jgi:hypothetical protein